MVTGEKRRWFRAKRYGYGWFPSAWQGWAVIGAYLLVMIGTSWLMATRPALDLVYCAAMLLGVLATLGLVYVAYRTGDTPHWHWGGSDDDKRA